MLTILIVDDDSIIRQGLIKIIDKMDLPPLEFLQAEDGDIALEICKKNMPSIVITDIKMKRLNGLDFISQAKKLSSNTEFIVLSGYSDFEYAKTAIENNVISYLVKPVIKSELKKVLLNAIERRNDTQTVLADKENLRSHFFKDCAVNYNRENDYISQLEKFKLQYDGFVCVCATSPLDNKFDLNDNLKKTLKFSHTKLSQYVTSKKNINLIYNINEKDYTEFVDAFKNIANKNLLSVYFGISSFNKNINTLHIQANETKLISITRFIQSSPSYCVFDSKNNKICNFSYMNWYLPKIKTALTEKNSDDLRSLLKQILDEFKNDKQLNCATLIEVMKDLFLSQFSEYFDGQYEFMTLFFSSFTLNDFIDGILAQMEKKSKTNDRHVLSKTYATNPKIKSAINFIEDNYKNIQSIADVAEFIGISSNHLSRLFKTELDINFSEYLLEFRLNIAKKLLVNPVYKTYEISYMVGIGDEKYFFKLFKKHFGITPKQFRETHQMQ